MSFVGRLLSSNYLNRQEWSTATTNAPAMIQPFCVFFSYFFLLVIRLTNVIRNLANNQLLPFFFYIYLSRPAIELMELGLGNISINSRSIGRRHLYVFTSR